MRYDSAMSNIYKGTRTDRGCLVTVNGRPLALQLNLVNHSPTGFEWGYFGSGPAQLALAILAHEVGKERALLHYQEFKRLVISALPHDGWTFTSASVVRELARIEGTPE